MPIRKIVSIEVVIPEDRSKNAQAYAGKFKRALELDVARIDELVEAYNQVEEHGAKLEALAALEREVDRVDREYPDELKVFFPDYYQKFHKQLFQDILKEKAIFTPVPEGVPLSFPEYLKIMPIEKAERMLSVLLAPDFRQEKLAEQVFDENEPGREAFLKMLSRYEISVLGGGNSKNFTVLDLHTGKTNVLKAENRMAMPKSVVKHLRDRSMQEVFTEDASEREVMCTHPVDGKPAMRTLLFTEFQPAGSLNQHSKAQPTPEERVESALDLYLQMAICLRAIEQDGCCFPDMKNGNWLVDEVGKLRIADKKSFLHARTRTIEQEDMYGEATTRTMAFLNLDDEENTFYAILRSKHMETPELATISDSREVVNASKMHAYMLGKNLYQYLTGCKDSYFHTYDKKGKVTGTKHNVASFDFTDPVFKTSKGAELEHLIKSLIYTSEEHADLTLQAAEQELAFLQYPDLLEFSFEHEELVSTKLETYQMLKDIERFRINAADSVMNDFVQGKRELIQAADTEEDLVKIRGELRDVYRELRENQAQHLAIQATVRRLSSSSSSSLVRKGSAIEAAYLRVPLLERTAVANGETEAQKAVLNEMQREVGWRISKWFGRRSEPSQEIKENFVRFKEEFTKEKPGNVSNQENVPPNLK